MADDEDQSDYSDQDQPQVQAPQPPAAPVQAPMPILPPAGVTAPRPVAPWLPTAEESMIQQMRIQNKDVPRAQADAAVAAALKFQATSGYHRDLQNGVSPADALAKWAPMMFTQPGGGGNLGQAASFMRATQPRMIDVGGVLYRQNPNGSVTPLTQPKPVAPKVNPLDIQEYKTITEEIAKTESALDDDPQGPAADAKRDKLNYLRQQAQAIRTRASGAAPAAISGPASAPVPRRAPVAAPATARVTSKAEYDALPPGTVYIGKNGLKYRKP